MRLAGKVALVTGAARGIGASTVTRLRAEGARVVATDIAAPTLKGGSDLLALALDVTRVEDWTAAVDRTLAVFGRLDILVGNAGLAVPGTIETMLLTDHERMFAVNVTGVLLGMRAVIPAMRAAGGGSILNISSIDGMVGAAGMTSYAGTKFAVRGMSRSAALELGRDGIRVNSIHPGVIETPPLESAIRSGVIGKMVAGQPIARMGAADEVANMIVFLASDEASYCTGGEYLIDGGRLAGGPAM